MFHPFQIDEGVLVGWVQLEDLSEERRAGTEDHPVTFDQFVLLAHQADVTELQAVVLPFEGLAGTLVELFPDQLVSLGRHAGMISNIISVGSI